METKARKRRKRLVGVGAAFLLGLLGAEGLARVVTSNASGYWTLRGRPLLPFRPAEETLGRELAAQTEAGDGSIMPDPYLGWTLAPGAGGSNVQGVRVGDSKRVFDEVPPQDKVRILTVGDSFTYCDDVDAEGSWQHGLEELDAGLEVLNMGVPGYGSDQAWLRWRHEGRQLKSDIVVLGIWSENVCRNVNVLWYYLYPTLATFSKPLLVLGDDGASRLVNYPVMSPVEAFGILGAPVGHSVLEHDLWYREPEVVDKPFYGSRALRVAASLRVLSARRDQRMRFYLGRDTRADDVTVEIARRFCEEVKNAGSTPLVLLLPMRDLAEEHLAGEVSLPGRLAASGIPTLDLTVSLTQAFKGRGDEMYTRPSGGHHTALGNRILAKQLLEALMPSIKAAKARSK